MRIYFKNNCDKLRSDPIFETMEPYAFLKTCPNNNKNKKSSDMRSVPDLKTLRVIVSNMVNINIHDAI